jgi:nicotinamidase-related amidase
MLLKKDTSQLLLIDIQEKLFTLQSQKEIVLKGSQFLIEVSHILSVPILLSEQYPKGLGKTIPEILSYGFKPYEKNCFSCAEDISILKEVQKLNRPQIILAGMEAHICVLQTAFGLNEAGFSVFVVEDAISSRSTDDKRIALERMRANGIQIVTSEMVCYEWLYQSGTAGFKQINELIKQR